MTEDLKERVTDKEILLKLATLDGDEQGKYVHKIGSQRMAEHLHYLLSNKKLPDYIPCSDGFPCTA